MKTEQSDRNILPPSTPPAPGNTPAVVSLVLGILMFVPLITSLLAIVFAAMGLRKAQHNQAGGKGLAIAGLILGIIGVLGWSAGGIAAYRIYRSAATAVDDLRNPGQAAASRFIKRLSEGQVNSALQETDGDPEARGTAQRLSLDMRQWGSFKDIAVKDWDLLTVNGATHLKLVGQANFTRVTRQFSITLARQGNSLRIVDYTFQ